MVKREHATAGLMLAPGGFGPKVLEQQMTLQRKKVFLKGAHDLQRWFEVWQRQYDQIVMERLDPVELLGLRPTTSL